MREPESKLPKTTPKLPQRHIFMTGNGKCVPPSCSADFVEQGVLDSLTFDVEMRAWFQLGFIAAVDMIARGTLDFSDTPSEAIGQAWRDVHNIMATPNNVTDIMRIDGEAL